MSRKQRKIIVVAVLGVAVIWGIVLGGFRQIALWGEVLTLPKEKKMDADVPRKSYCMGRLVFDLPAEVAVTPSPGGFSIGRIDTQIARHIDRVGGEKEFREEVESARVGFPPPGRTTLLLEAGPLTDNADYVVQIVGPTLPNDIFLDVYAYLPTGLFRLRVSGALGDEAALKAEIRKVLAAYRPLAPEEIPERGLCLGDAVLDLPPGGYESVSGAFILPPWGHPLNFSLESVSSPAEPDTLHKKDYFHDPEAQAILRSLGGVSAVVREHRRMAGGMNGHEFVFALGDSKDNNYDFTWEYDGTPKDPFQPQISLDRDAKSADAARGFYLWDAVLDTLRPLGQPAPDLVPKTE